METLNFHFPPCKDAAMRMLAWSVADIWNFSPQPEKETQSKVKIRTSVAGFSEQWRRCLTGSSELMMLPFQLKSMTLVPPGTSGMAPGASSGGERELRLEID